MPRKGGVPENLNPPIKTANEARRLGKNGGKASGVARREKKLMSQIYGEFLAERFKVRVDGKDQEITGADLVGRVVKTVLNDGGAPAVSLMKEIREATEGTKSQLTIETYTMTPDERKARLAELEAERLNDGK